MCVSPRMATMSLGPRLPWLLGLVFSLIVLVSMIAWWILR